jgi:TPR repeat protein
MMVTIGIPSGYSTRPFTFSYPIACPKLSLLAMSAWVLGDREMKCVLCKMCEAWHASFQKKMDAWLYAQSNNVEIMERETDPEAVYQAYEGTDPVESFRQYLALAEKGSVWCMATAGQMFQTGTGTTQDLAQAEKWLVRAYQAGSDYGLICLGCLYERSERSEQAQDVYRTGVERGFVPAMVYLASSYRKSPEWTQRRSETLKLLERGRAAGDLFARHWLATAMVRGWFGLKYVPEGIRRLPSVAHDMVALVEDETASSRGNSKTRPGFISRLAAQLWLVGATRHPAS